MTHAYDPLYLAKASRTVGMMLHDAVYVFHWDGSAFLTEFIRSGIATQVEKGNPMYIAGKSGLELYLDVIRATTGDNAEAELVMCLERTDAYWVGWMLTHYQWYSCHSFAEILSVVPYPELLGLYKILHEADIQKSYDVLDAHFAHHGNADIL